MDDRIDQRILRLVSSGFILRLGLFGWNVGVCKDRAKLVYVA